MAINLQNYRESKARSGYGACLMFIDPLDTTAALAGKYRLFIPLETVPSIEGSVDSFEFDLTNGFGKGKVSGKTTLDDKDVEFLWHRDNVMRLEKYEDMVLNFMVVYADFTAQEFIGTIKVRPNDVSGDVARGTLTITPMSINAKTVYDCRSKIVPTVAFTTAIPDSVDIKSNDTTGKFFSVECDPVSATVTATVDTASTGAVNAAYSNGKVTISAKEGATAGTKAMVTIKASADNYASWEQTVLVELVTAS